MSLLTKITLLLLLLVVLNICISIIKPTGYTGPIIGLLAGYIVGWFITLKIINY